MSCAWTAAPILKTGSPSVHHGYSCELRGAPGTSFAEMVRRELSPLNLPQGVPAYTLRQVHSNIVMKVPFPDTTKDTSLAEGGAPEGDGLILGAEQDGLIAVQAADCVPVLAVHGASGDCAALHAGWRGTAAAILPGLLERWDAQAGLRSARIALGPSIRSCCYEVREDCLAAFRAHDLDRAVAVRHGRSYLDLTRVLRNQARRLGLEDWQVEVVGACTHCARENGHPPYASFRRDGRPGQPYVPRNAAFIGRW